jgi:RimJ/RimL family protein N-acetyltransferase
MYTWHNNDIDIQKYLHIGPYNCEYDFRLYFVNSINSNQKIFIAKLKQPDENNSVVCWCRINKNTNTFTAWVCNPKYRNMGYTSEMVEAILNDLNIEKTSARIDSRNIASQKVAEKSGFIYTAVYPSTNRCMNEYVYKK